MRRDAEANRERLLRAGRRAMQDLGGGASIEAICEAAGVTRATFYRHFADRAELHLAVLDHELDQMRRELARAANAPLAFLRLLADMMMVYDRYLLALPDLPEFDQAEASACMIRKAIAPSLRHAKELALIRPDITDDDVLVACRMAGSDWRLDLAPSRKEALDRRMALIFDGLGAQRSDGERLRG